MNSRVEDIFDWAVQYPEDAILAAESLRMLRIDTARKDPNEFVEFVMRDDETEQPVRQAPIHEQFQSLASRYPRLILWSCVEAGKTTQLAVARVLFELGRNPNLRIAIVSQTFKQATKTLQQITKYIEESAELRATFPLKLMQASATQILVERTSRARDPSVQVSSVGTGSILGSRLDLVILDDILTFENTRTPEARQHTLDWLNSTLFGRLTRNARVWAIGNAYHPEDAYHRLSANPVWHYARFPVIDPETGLSAWPDKWPASRIAFKQRELPPHEFARQMLCVARDDNEARFRRKWIEQCLDRGDGKLPAVSLRGLPPGYGTFTGVDLAVSRKRKSDLTCLFTIIVHPNGDREVLSIESGRWSGKEIISRIVDVHNRFDSIVIVENNAAQDYLRQFVAADTDVPVRPFYTGTNKANPEFGLESLATEMSNAKWIIPSVGGKPADDEIAAWVQDMLYYDPNAHTGDRLMASWFAREGCRKARREVAVYGKTNIKRR
jgi:hypothetical protein